MAISGIHAFLDILAEFGVHYIFGNPGTSELPLNDALVGDDRFAYILGLQEVPVMGIADGYSMASGQLGVVNLHISCGLGNAMGILYNAFREGTPLLVTAGQQDRRLMLEEPILYGDLVGVAKPWTKWAYEVTRVEQLPTVMRRAIQAALTPPTGPVFLSLPMDLQQELFEPKWRSPLQLPDARVRPPVDALRRAATCLAAAERPVILAGSRVAERQASVELENFAEQLGAPVIPEPGTSHGRLPMRSDHPLYAAGLPLWSPEVRQRLAPYDVLFVTGMDLLRQYVYHEPAEAIPDTLKVIHLDEDPWQLGKNYPLEVALMGDTKVGLAELTEQLATVMSTTQSERAQRRREHITLEHQQARQRLQALATEETHQRPISPLVLMNTLASILPDDVAVIEAAVTSTNTTLERLGAIKDPHGYFGHRGWSLGWGLNVTIGAQLAWPNRPVLGLIGDGAAMYGIQGLWTAAHHQIPATFVICNNSQYQILKVGAKGLDLAAANQGKYVGLDLTQPEIDFVAIASALGVTAMRVSEPDDIAQAVRESLAGSKPVLVDVPISRHIPDRLSYG